jgi:hypothetical protein
MTQASNLTGETISPFPKSSLSGVYPNVACLLRGKTRKSASDEAARRVGQVEAYLTVREVLSEASTAADGVLSRERSGFYRSRHATLGYSLSGFQVFPGKLLPSERGVPIRLLSRRRLRSMIPPKIEDEHQFT